MANLTISHTHADGTQLTGSRKGDGVLELVRPHGFTWRRASGIHIQWSRDKPAQTRRIDSAAAALRAAGHDVTVTVDDTWRPAAEREADRAGRIEARVDRLDERAGLAAGRSAAASAAHDRIADGIPFGQPILVGHHSEGRARSDHSRMNTLTSRAHDEAGYAAHLAGRASGAAANEAAKQNPRAIARRIETLETEARDIARKLAGHTRNFRNGADVIVTVETHGPATGEWAVRLAERAAVVAEDIAHQRGKLAAMEESGAFVAWSPSNLAKGDEVRAGNGWYRVTRVNVKTVSLDSPGWPRTMTWDGIHGRRRDGMQLDTPNGEPWPVELARQVYRWDRLVQTAARSNQYDTESVFARLHVEHAQCLVHGLEASASAAEVQAHAPDPADVATVRALAAACLAIHDRLAAGETVPDVAASLTPFGIEPTWRMPDGDPEDVRVDRVRPGDIVKGVWDRAGGGRTLWRHFSGVVATVSDVEHRRESGNFVTVTLQGGASYRAQTHVWFAVYPAASTS